MNDRNLHLIALAMTKGLGPVTVKQLIAYCGSPKAVWTAPKRKLLKAPGIGQHAIQLVRNSATLMQAERELNWCQDQGVEVLTYLDAAYPHPLKYIHDAPLVLFKKGQIDFNRQPAVAIVGTRKATDRGKELTEQFGRMFSQAGLNVVSGLAYGIDIAAHRTVLKHGGMTTAVLAHGLDQIYPWRHRHKAEEMLERGGWLSEYFTRTKPEAMHFPARNRIISGMCQAVLVVEAAEKGGALITARYAFEQNRQVYAIPGRIGDPYAIGCNELIRRHIAQLATKPEEVLEGLEIQWNPASDPAPQLALELAPPQEPLSPDESKVLNLLAQGSFTIDQITDRTGIPISRLNPLLLTLEFKELLRQTPGKKFRRVI
ncbi:DNA-processing protein DprA [Pontibacter sp. G13]|uniref:DNA-processing protein DprA n=1 Tax=Pontibacter sp. G13 TaxID=3074898 RepID=UPI00288C2D0B|nr:DNA-processing protein DprA [Pontibacter sp. G13]WNJ20736.1 DNA-processing protein DprA [Pontibacter sp. G13]